MIFSQDTNFDVNLKDVNYECSHWLRISDSHCVLTMTAYSFKQLTSKCIFLTTEHSYLCAQIFIYFFFLGGGGDETERSQTCCIVSTRTVMAVDAPAPFNFCLCPSLRNLSGLNIVIFMFALKTKCNPHSHNFKLTWCLAMLCEHN